MNRGFRAGYRAYNSSFGNFKKASQQCNFTAYPAMNFNTQL